MIEEQSAFQNAGVHFIWRSLSAYMMAVCKPLWKAFRSTSLARTKTVRPSATEAWVFSFQNNSVLTLLAYAGKKKKRKKKKGKVKKIHLGVLTWLKYRVGRVHCVPGLWALVSVCRIIAIGLFWFYSSLSSSTNVHLVWKLLILSTVQQQYR